MTIQEMNEIKRERGYTYEQIAALSGVPLSTVRKVLGGKTRSPRYATLRSLAKVFEEDALPRGVSEAKAVYAAKQDGEYTLEDYLALPDDQRVELIDGVFYEMSTPKGYHQLIAGQLYSILLAWIRSKGGKCMPFISPVDVQLDCDNRTIVQPDVLILCDPAKYTPDRIVGAPDFIAEVLSRSTQSKDMVLKLNKYMTAGVREYWMIDPLKKLILTYHFENNNDYAVYTFRDKVPVKIYGGELVIDFAEIDDTVNPWM